MKANRKNIFIDCHVLDGTYQGTTTYITGLYREAVKDLRFSFYFAADDITYARRAFGEAENIYYIKYPSRNKFLRLLVTIPYFIMKHNIHYAHFQYIVPPIKLCRYITTIHDILFIDYPEFFPTAYKIRNKTLFRWSAKKSDIVATVSQYSAKQLKHHFGVEAIVTSNAVDNIYYEQYDKKTAKATAYEKFGVSNYWLFVSRWEPRKNHQALLKVFVEKEYYKTYHLVLAGYKDMVNTEFDTLYVSLPDEIKTKVTILGSIEFNDLLTLVRGAALSVYPSLAEGFGIPPLESAAAGTPTACSNATAMSDFVFFGDKLFDPKSPKSMATAIKKALSDNDTAEKQKAIAERYNWNDSAKVLLDAIYKNSQT